MKEKIAALGLKLFGAKFIRQVLAALGGWLAAQGTAVDVFDLPSLIGGLIAFVLASIWSWRAKSPPNADAKASLSLFAQAGASQAIAAMAGWLQALGYTGAVDDSAGVMLFLANYGLSQLSRPDSRPDGRAVSERPAGV